MQIRRLVAGIIGVMALIVLTGCSPTGIHSYSGLVDGDTSGFETVVAVLLVVAAVSIVIGAVSAIRALLRARDRKPMRRQVVAACVGFGLALVLVVTVLVIGSMQLTVIATAP